ncbi:MAG: endonuclease/exonuclease/phosphatase family protein [Motiliproteus sp.]|nr:endonuclease/exonuclease/phosphatase family protein [Motiliproteus sp.]MCW9053113.1 endonuclease/exonuclease/phosphatase family protein [Motiliproteus sp.]
MIRNSGHLRSMQTAVKRFPAFEHPRSRNSLKLLTFNIQVGIRTHAPHHYVTRGWQHLLPHSERYLTLDQIAKVIADYDLVALQEADGGSFRSSYVNQVQYLAKAARFPYWYQQLNRDLGKFAQHSNGLLSHLKPNSIEDHQLPGFVPGRGAICAEVNLGRETLLLVILHLSLGKRSRGKQLAYLRQLIGDHKSVVIMGDLNCHHDVILNNQEFSNLPLQTPHRDHLTFPSWRPSHALDHILVSDNLQVLESHALDITISDHRPIALEIKLPQNCSEQPAVVG